MIEEDVIVDGRRVHVRSAGSGPPMVLLHAVGESSFSWRPVLPALAGKHHVIAPDFPGFGDSEPQDTGPTPYALTDFADRFLHAVTAEAATVVGNSLGGLVALRLALRHPERVARLVLVSSGGLGRYVHPALRTLALPGYGDLAIAAARTRPGATQRAWLRLPLLFSNPALAPPEWIAEQRRLGRLPHHLATTLKALRAQVSPLGQRQVLLAELADVQMPTLVVWGRNDLVLPVSQAHAAAERIRHARLEVIPRCGHLPQLEQPESFVPAIGRFLDD